ncbi:MAG TPA: DUF6351 family protein, partial [Nevskiaceae bacterium]|nr:DUF6351 family protein [Nevskiaceae bacterium]
DCHLLDHVFNDLSPQLWSALPQRALVEGYATPVTCDLFDDPAGQFEYSRLTFDPSYAVSCQGGPIAAASASGEWADTSYVYNAQSNPTGTRCTVQDYGVAVWGRRAADGFANRPYDNTGVQYGLSALNQGLITAGQFVDLNEKIGGIDIDWNYQPQRSVADPFALTVAYRGGRVDYPRESAKVPIIDLRGFSPEEIHTDVHSYSMRARLDQANGNHDNQVIWNGGAALFPDPGAFATSFLTMDAWLSAIEADTSSDPLEVKVVRNKPAGAVDACWIGEQKITDAAVCAAAFPYFGTPRIAAGGPLADNIFKCQLKPLDRASYSVSFTDAQWAQLQSAFPTGVCDYAQAPVGWQPTVPWLSYAGGPGGQPLGDAPKSMAISPAQAHTRFGGAVGICTSMLLVLGALVRRRLRQARRQVRRCAGGAVSGWARSCPGPSARRG